MRRKKTYYFLTFQIKESCSFNKKLGVKQVYSLEILTLTQRELEEEMRRRLCESFVIIEGREVEIDNIIIQTKYKEVE